MSIDWFIAGGFWMNMAFWYAAGLTPVNVSHMTDAFAPTFGSPLREYTGGRVNVRPRQHETCGWLPRVILYGRRLWAASEAGVLSNTYELRGELGT